MKFTFIALTLILVLLLTTIGLIPRNVARAETGAVIDPLLQAALSVASGPVEVIVTFNSTGAPTAVEVQLLKDVGITAGVTFRALPIAGVLASGAQVNALATRPEVRSLYFNRHVIRENAEATALTGVDRLRTESAFTTRNGGLPVSGQGVGVLINDSGVDGTHRDHEFGKNLVQNVLGSANLHAQNDLLPITYVENVANTDSTGGHGTHVAGIVGANGALSGGKYEGVAPGANLVGYGTGAALAILDTLGGFDYALYHQAEYGIRVVTNSWGDTGDRGPFDPSDPVNVATKLCFDRNIVVVFSAGNSGPGESTISGNYKKAPWVITVAAGEKQGRLASFSSRGVKDRQGTAVVDGQTWNWEDRPTVTAPGVSIVSTRVVAPVSALGAPDDVNLIEPAYLPFYTTMSGTSMAAPHVAGIVALMLDANPALTPTQVKQLLQETATNVPGREAWEVGAGYVNAYGAVDQAFQARAYGGTLNMTRAFHSNAVVSTRRTDFAARFNPMAGASEPQPFAVSTGMTEIVVRAQAPGLLATTGNPINLVLTAPNGTKYSSGVSALFALYPDRTVSVADPMTGIWSLQLKGIGTGGVALPETVYGYISLKRESGYTGLNDITAHPAVSAIKLAVSKRLVDGDSDRRFRPDEYLTRLDLAHYLTMGAEVRQYLPPDGSRSFSDVKPTDLPFAEAVAARGAALRDTAQGAQGPLLPVSAGQFAPSRAVNRAELAYSLVQSLGLEADGLARNGGDVTVQYGADRIPIEDAAQIPAEVRGYVQVALDLNVLNAYFYTSQDPFDLQPVMHATFRPQQRVTRADYAVAMIRFFNAWLSE